MFQIKTKILKQKKIADHYFRLMINAPVIAELAIPGQFVNILVNDANEPLLRRPLSIHRVVGGPAIEIIYEVKGKATQILSQKKAGDFLDIIGPLGNGFDFNPQAILVAGGMGVAPLFFLAERLVHGPRLTAHRKPIVLIGAKTKNQILCEKEFKKLGCDVKIATDNGSRGFKGRVTDLLKEVFVSRLTSHVSCLMSRTCNVQRVTLYACGPKPMLKEIAIISRRYKIPAQVSLEEHIACGIGACLGCVVNTGQGYRRVCKDGPVFNAKEIIW